MFCAVIANTIELHRFFYSLDTEIIKIRIHFRINVTGRSIFLEISASDIDLFSSMVTANSHLRLSFPFRHSFKVLLSLAITKSTFLKSSRKLYPFWNDDTLLKSTFAAHSLTNTCPSSSSSSVLHWIKSQPANPITLAESVLFLAFSIPTTVKGKR